MLTRFGQIFHPGGLHRQFKCKAEKTGAQENNAETYTATGFSNPVRVIFEAVFRPVIFDEMKETVAEHFLIAVKSQRQEVDILERTIFRPGARLGQSLAALLGKIHSGSVNLYAAYILISLGIVLIIQRLR